MFSRSRRHISDSVRYSGSTRSASRGPKELRSREEPGRGQGGRVYTNLYIDATPKDFCAMLVASEFR